MAGNTISITDPVQSPIDDMEDGDVLFGLRGKASKRFLASTIPPGDGTVTLAKLADGTANTALGYDGDGAPVVWPVGDTEDQQSIATTLSADSGITNRQASQAEAESGANNSKLMTPQRTRQAIQIFASWVSASDPQFAGGVKANGIDDDAPAMRAFIAYMKALPGYSLYGGGGPTGYMPGGIIKLASAHPTKTDRYLDTTACHNMNIIGQGDGATTLKGTGNLAVMRADDTVAAPLYRHILRDFAIEGSGWANANADNIDWGANNNCQTHNVRSWAGRRALAYANSFHSEHWNLRANGQGGLANYNCVYAKDGEPGVVENAVGFFGGRMWGAKSWTIRGESMSGSNFNLVEFLGGESTGIYIGDSPSGKDLKWVNFVGCLVDTCTDLVVVKKGSSSVAELVSVNLCWAGYAYEGLPRGGGGVEFVGLKNSSFSTDILTNVEYAAVMTDCQNVAFEAKVISDYDRLLTGGAAIVCNNTTWSSFKVGTTKKAPGSSSAAAFVEQGSSNYNSVYGTYDGAVTLIGAKSKKFVVEP